eukprot:scaffold1921_cov132-Skeletonema_menzelii.AAC.2
MLYHGGCSYHATAIALVVHNNSAIISSHIMLRVPLSSSLLILIISWYHGSQHPVSVFAFSPPFGRSSLRLPSNAPYYRGTFAQQHMSIGNNMLGIATNMTSSDLDSDSGNVGLSSSSSSSMAVTTFGMPDLTQMVDNKDDQQKLAGAGRNLLAAALLLMIVVGANSFGGHTPPMTIVMSFLSDPSGMIQSMLTGLSPTAAMMYFGIFYVVAELIAIPATPLTLTAGYLFGVANGTAIVFVAGIISAIVGFGIGRVLLRERVEGVLEDKPTFRKLDSAIGTEGLKLLVLARLAPIFPFSLLNYFYGASSISFPTFVSGTMLGFIPTTLIYVYTGLAGKELMRGGGSQPWFVYAGSVLILLAFLKLTTDAASDIIQAVDETE